MPCGAFTLHIFLNHEKVIGDIYMERGASRRPFKNCVLRLQCTSMYVRIEEHEDLALYSW